MSLFSQPKPRKFHHDFMFVDERKDKLKAIEDRAKSELGMTDKPLYDGERLRGRFLNATKYTRRRNEKRLSGGIVLSFGVLVILILLLVSVWKILLCL